MASNLRFYAALLVFSNFLISILAVFVTTHLLWTFFAVY